MVRRAAPTVKPILVTGSPRSGTTWVGRMMAPSEQLYYIHEPFNPDYPPGSNICNVRFKHHQTYITEENEHFYYQPIKQMIQGHYNFTLDGIVHHPIKGFRSHWSQWKRFQHYHHNRMVPLIKDPVALMSAGWMARRFDIHVVVMIRHPAAVVASMKRLNWGFDPKKWALSQPLLLRDHLLPFKDELTLLSASKSDIVDQIALLWKIAYAMVLTYQADFPGWVYLKLEELAEDPLDRFALLFERLGLKFTDTLKRRITEHSSESNPTRSTGKEKLIKLNSKKAVNQWKKHLSTGEISRVREIVEEVSKFYYADCTWEI